MSIRQVAPPAKIGVENSLHWQLDMSFGEDRSRVKEKITPTPTWER